VTYDELTSVLLRTEIERDEARAIARRLAESLSADSTRNEQLSALDAFEALPWAADGDAE
jgi:hypothetical protein